MREIKYRAWDNKVRCMDYDLWIHFDGRVFDYSSRTYDTPNREIELADEGRFDIMQYTGLKDRDGKEIYEGDRVKFHNGVGELFLGAVQFNDGCFDIVVERAGYPIRDYLKALTINHAVEVIGNIYEHPFPPEA